MATAASNNGVVIEHNRWFPHVMVSDWRLTSTGGWTNRVSFPP